MSMAYIIYVNKIVLHIIHVNNNVLQIIYVNNIFHKIYFFIKNKKLVFPQWPD